METVQPHDHAVDLDTALDFVNTLEVRRRPGSRSPGNNRRGAGLVARPRPRPLRSPGAIGCRLRAAPHPSHPGRAAELADATYEHRAPAQDAVDEVNRALRAREVVQLVPGPGGLQLDHRHVGDPIDDALANLSRADRPRDRRRATRAAPGMRQRHLPVGLLRLLAARAVDAGATCRAAATRRRPPGTAPGPRATRAGARLSVSRGRRCSPGGRRRVDDPVGLPAGQERPRSWSRASASCSSSACAMPTGTTIRSRTLPLTWIGTSRVSSTIAVVSTSGQLWAWIDYQFAGRGRRRRPQLLGDVRRRRRQHEQQQLDRLVPGGARRPRSPGSG